MTNLEPLMTSARTGDSSKDGWLTPLWLFEKLDAEFDFNLDPAATDENTLCDSWYTEKEDGLIQPWWGSVFVNCPYSELKKWTKKAYEEIQIGNCSVIVMLIAARTDTKAFWDYFRQGEVRLLKSRLKFESIDRSAIYSAPFPSAVVIFKKGFPDKEKIIYWDMKESK